MVRNWVGGLIRGDMAERWSVRKGREAGQLIQHIPSLSEEFVSFISLERWWFVFERKSL